MRRPTTSRSLASVWGPDGAGALLDWLEVPDRHRVATEVDDLDGLVLLDVPDHDSVVEANREEMERIAEHADVLAWVTDPEKYADKALHDYLARLAGHGSVTVVVLNKADLLPEADVAACRTDLRRLLAAAGLGDAPVVTLSTTKGDGRDELVAVIREAVASKEAAVQRLAADTSLAADELGRAAGAGAGPAEVPSPVAGRLAADLVQAAGIDAVGSAVAAGHRRDGARSTGWPFTRWLRRLRPHPLGRLHLDRGSTGRASLPQPSGLQRTRTQGALRDAAAAVTADLTEPWPTHLRAAASPDEDVLADRIDQAVAQAVRDGRRRDPRWWTVVGALQWALAAAAVAGLLWLTLLAGAAYLRLPDPPTPDVRGFPLPTALLVGGLVVGLVVAWVAARLIRLGARREARAVERRAERAVGEVADELVIEPMNRELQRMDELRRLIERAAGSGSRSLTRRR